MPIYARGKLGELIKAIDKSESRRSSRYGTSLKELSIYARGKLGEILEKLPKPKFDKQLNGSLRGTTKTLPQGITKKDSYFAQQIAKHPEDKIKDIDFDRGGGDTSTGRRRTTSAKGKFKLKPISLSKNRKVNRLGEWEKGKIVLEFRGVNSSISFLGKGKGSWRI